MERRGGSILAAVPILNAFMRDALPLVPNELFTTPDPITSSKPMLSGEYAATYQSGGTIYPQIHNILYYVNRADPLGAAPTHPENDSQFAAWEQGVLAWAGSTIPNFLPGLNYNLPVPKDAILIDGASDSTAGSIIMVSPASGSFIQNNQLSIDARIQSQKEIIRIEAFFNGSLIDIRNGTFGPSPVYQVVFSTGAASPQNVLKITATDITGVQISKEVVVYR